MHTYEHIRSLPSPVLQRMILNWKKLSIFTSKEVEHAVTPSGGPIGDEWIFERTAHATDTGYEYCSIQELMDSWLFLLAKTNDLSFADKVEKYSLTQPRAPGTPNIAASPT